MTGDKVLVNADNSELFQSDKVITKLAKGTRFRVIKVGTNRLFGFFDVEDKRRAGWIRKKEVSFFIGS